MTQKLNDAICAIGKVDALMFAMESTFLVDSSGLTPEEHQEFVKRRESVFYAIWDAVIQVKEDLVELSG